jgi:hypothetical protein
VNASTARAISWLHDPGVTLGVSLFDLQEMRVEFAKLIRKDVSVRNEIILTGAKLFLRPDIVVAKTILAGNFITLREMVNALILVKAFIQERLAAGAGPEHVPLVALRVVKLVGFE